MLAIVFSSALSGLIISLTGNYWNILVFGPWLVCVGAGLLYTLHETSPNSRYIGYQVGTNHNQQSFTVPRIIKRPIDHIRDGYWRGYAGKGCCMRSYLSLT